MRRAFAAALVLSMLSSPAMAIPCRLAEWYAFMATVRRDLGATEADTLDRYRSQLYPEYVQHIIDDVYQHPAFTERQMAARIGIICRRAAERALLQ